MSTVEPHVRTDEFGVLRVDSARKMLDPTIADRPRNAMPGRLPEQPPALDREGIDGTTSP